MKHKNIQKTTFQTSFEQKTLLKNWEKYRGNIVMVVGEEIFSTKKAHKVNEIVDTIEKRFHRRPLITYIPKEGALVLFLSRDVDILSI